MSFPFILSLKKRKEEEEEEELHLLDKKRFVVRNVGLNIFPETRERFFSSHYSLMVQKKNRANAAYVRENCRMMRRQRETFFIVIFPIFFFTIRSTTGKKLDL
jgi:hypothetical protein